MQEERVIEGTEREKNPKKKIRIVNQAKKQLGMFSLAGIKAVFYASFGSNLNSIYIYPKAET